MNLRVIARRARSGGFLRGGLMVLAGAAILAGNVAGGCSSTSKMTQVDVPMNYTPRAKNAMPSVALSAGPQPKVFVAPTVDKRQNPTTIGMSSEDDTTVPVYASGRTPAEFFAEVLRQEATTTGMQVAPDAAGADRVLETEILEFSVTESGTYKGSVRVKAVLLDKDKKQLWGRIVSGQGSNYGKSRNATNYQETFSDATREAIGHILGDPAFAAALNAQASAAPAPAPGPVVPAPAAPTAP